jgi:hypothetical protein
LGFAIAVYLANWPLNECCLALAVALITAVTPQPVLSDSGVSS